MKAKNKKIQILLDEFRNKGQLSIQDICNLFNCSRPTAYSYISSLKDNNYEITKTTVNRREIYCLENMERPYYQPLTLNHIRKYRITQALQEKPISVPDFAKHFILNKNEFHNYDKIPLDINQTSFYELIKELKQEKEIAIQAMGKNQKNNLYYYLTGKTIPLVLSLTDEQLLNLSDELCNIVNDTPYYKDLFSIFQKTSLLLGNTENSFFQNYIFYGRKYENFSVLSHKLKSLFNLNYENKILEIEYQNTLEQTNLLFGLGMIVYCVEKDNIYLIGRKFNSKNQKESEDYIIRADKIINIKETDLDNKYYLSSYFLDVFDEMFSISVEPKQEVCVEFDIFGNIEKKINYLKAHRKHAKIDLNRDSKKIIYTDTIRGLGDFSSFLRTFGKAARVIKPQALIDIMRSSVNETLNRYGAEELGKEV